jgi:two-component system CheB/CheR fusion protein
MIIDITEIKESSEKLKRSEERSRSFIELTGQIAWVTNSAGEVEEDIPYFRKFTGLNYNKVKGTGWTKALHPDDTGSTITVWNEAVSTKSPYETEYRIRRHDGEFRNMLAKGFPVLDNKGNVSEWIGTCIDITERKKTEEVIKDNEKRFRELIESLPQLFWTCRVDGPCDYLSKFLKNNN